jgi:hypothetical protein
MAGSCQGKSVSTMREVSKKAVFFLDRQRGPILPMPFFTWKVTIRFAEALLTPLYDDNEVINHG